MVNKQLSSQTERVLTKQFDQHLRKNLSKHIITKAEFLGSQFKQHVSTAIIAAFSFLIALSWKDLIIHLVESAIPKNILEAFPYISSLISTTIISLIAVLGIILVTRWAKSQKF